MSITVKFFARLKEELGVEELQIDSDSVTHLSELKAYLIGLHPNWNTALQRQCLMAVNQTMAPNDQAISSGDEVALFPPVTGG